MRRNLTFLLKKVQYRARIGDRKGVKIIHKIEEIRAKLGMNQTDFAEALGMSKRTYIYRTTGEQPNWTLDELIKAAALNKGTVEIDHEGKTFQIKIKEIK